MKSLLILVLLNILDPGTSTCFEEQPLDPKLQEYLALKKSCANTLFPEPPCCGNSVENENANSTSRIINGVQTGLREQTWNVYLEIYFRNLSSGQIGVFACGGSLINPLWVLTAAHCLTIPGLELLKVEAHLGEWNIKTDPDCINNECADKVKILPERNVVIHPKYKNDEFKLGKYDIALVRLERPAIYSDFITPVCLPLYPLKKECFENQKATVTGWGDTVPHVKYSTPSDIKLKTTLSIWETNKCVKYMKIANTVSEDEYPICASEGKNNGCRGDSGGPLSLKLKNSNYYYLLGVVSGGHGLCNPAYPAIFNRIHLKWIVDVIFEAENNF